MELLKGKLALITGGSRGIGKAIAELFAQNGADIAFTYLHSEEKALALESQLKALGIKAKAYRSDAADYAAAEKLVADVITEFGKINVLVNNAGITRDNLLLRMSEDQWDEVLQSNLKSVFNLSKPVAKEMLLQRSGSIINLTSIVGLSGNAGQANYAASKAGIVGFTKSLAAELGSRKVRCNALSPGYIATDMTEKLTAEQKDILLKNVPLKRMGQPEDIAKAALFLASDMSEYISGQVLSVCGGMYR